MVRHISGEGEKPEPSELKKKKGVDAESFRDMMRVGKAREVDPEEKRKRKRREEAEGVAPGKPKAFFIEPSPPKAKGSEDKFKLSLEGKVGTGALPSAPSPPETYPQEEEYLSISEVEPAREKKEKRAEKKKGEPPTQKPKGKKIPKKGVPLERKLLIEPKAAFKPERTQTFFEELGKTISEKEKKIEEEVAEELAPPLPLPPGSWETIRTLEKEAEKELLAELPLTPSVPIQTYPEIPTGFAITGGVELHLPPQMIELFERMVGVMTVMNLSGITETTIHLTSPQFSNSIFYGSQIVISEFTTAPKAFNVEFKGSPQSIALIQRYSPEILATFAAGNYNFSVNRIETSLLGAGKPPVKKRGKVTRKKKA
ncbi:MAG: hypothetical protein L0207_00165 [Chlamydiae bacterium]|nr:hypothetical protein [Chlamydiota bacterium]